MLSVRFKYNLEALAKGFQARVQMNWYFIIEKKFDTIS